MRVIKVENEHEKITVSTLEEKRKTAARMFDNGATKTDIMVATDMSMSWVEHFIPKYKKEGKKAIVSKKRGRKIGEKRKLSPEQEQTIRKAIIDKDPNQYKFDCCVWDRQTVSLLIKELLGINIPVSTLGYYFARWGFTAQRPNLTNYKQNPKEVSEWLENKYPAIKEQAKVENAEILWGDETAIQNVCNYVKSYAPIGQTPVLKTKGERLKINMISAVSNQGKVRFMFYAENMTSQRLIKFMENLIRNAKRKIIFILDNLKVHHSKKVKKWLESHKDKIEMKYLPSYSPDLNPDEYLNGNLKHNMAKKPKTSDAKTLWNSAKDIMKKFQKNQQHGKSWFKNKKIAYAA